LTTTQIWQIAAVILTAGLLCYALANYLTSPIVKLRHAARQFAEGDLQTRLNIKRHDELGELAREFDQMAERIETLVTSEKRLTQDISHELRSPLARLNVALELARAKSDNGAKTFIERIETESNRLNEMISRLLVLSKLETGSETFSRSEVNLTKILE
jgi:two-component system sensor histidine kinase CpxA